MTSELALNIAIAEQIVLSKYPPKPVEVLYFHGRGFGDYTNLFSLASSLIQKKIVGRVVLFYNEGERFNDPTNTPYQANPGKTWVRDQLISYRVPDNKISWPKLDHPSGLHTQSESDDFIDFSRREKWTSGAIICQPHQALRAYLGWIKAMEEKNYWMELFVTYPTSTPWYEIVAGSQSLESKPRIEHISDEIKRIGIYQQKGDIATFDSFFKYIQNLESGSLKPGSN